MKYTFIAKCFSHCDHELHGRLVIIRTNTLKIDDNETQELKHFCSDKWVRFSTATNSAGSIYIIAHLESVNEEALSMCTAVSATNQVPSDIIEVDYLYITSN